MMRYRKAFLTGKPVRRKSPTGDSTPLHRLGAVRRQNGVSHRAVARHLGISEAEVKSQEQETTNISLRQLRSWQEVLKVPLAELLTEPGDSLSSSLLERAQLLRFMRTAMSVMEQTREASIRRMAETMVAQLIEIMPELRGVNPWPTTGQRRSSKDYGRAADAPIPDQMISGSGFDAARLEEI